MNHDELIRELSRRAGVSEAEAGAVFGTLLELVREGRVDAGILLTPAGASAATADSPVPPASVSDDRVVDDLIARARRHPLGLDFLREGFLASVAAEFGAHALTVEAARNRLNSEKRDEVRS